VRRELVRNAVPTAPGGGTVMFVDPIGHRYLDDPVAREEGGTPAIVESIRAGLVFALKQAVGTDLIATREQQLWRHAAGPPRPQVTLSEVSFGPDGQMRYPRPASRASHDRRAERGSLAASRVLSMPPPSCRWLVLLPVLSSIVMTGCAAATSSAPSPRLDR
jgi:hypothetical protein